MKSISALALTLVACLGGVAPATAQIMTPVLDQQVVGAIGVSGAHNAKEDDAIARAAVAAFSAPLPTAAGREEVAYLESRQVAQAFSRGRPLLETADYKIHASRREEAGQAEVHTRDTDIIYVLEGSVTFVTGGTVVDPQRSGPDEIRGTRIEGGTARALSKGDVMVVPAGVPHWFSQVDETFLYYVVKATMPEAAKGSR